MKITITLQDDEKGQVKIEEAWHLAPGETEESVTIASALADEMLSIASELGEAEELV